MKKYRITSIPQSLPKAQIGYVSQQDSIAHQADKVIKYEQLMGSKEGDGLPFYSDPKYKKMFMDIASKLTGYNSAMEKSEAADFIFNSGSNPKRQAIQEFYRKNNPELITKDKYGRESWSERNSMSDADIDELYKTTVGSLKENDRRVMNNLGRDWYYKNSAPKGVSYDYGFDANGKMVKGENDEWSPAYQNTWYGRIHNTNTYNEFDPDDKAFIHPTKRKYGGELPQAQTGLSINLNKFFKKKKPFVDPYEGSTLPSSSRTVNRPLGLINKYDFTGLDETYKKLALAQEKIEQQNQIEQQELYDQKKAAEKADWDIKYQEIQKQDVLRQEEQNRINNYYKGLYDSKKSDKIEPLYENINLTSEQIDKYKNTGEYYVQKNNDDTYSLWPNEALYIKIIDNGFKDRDFKKLWGLDGEQVREQMGELIDEREMSYDKAMLDKITNTAFDENKTPEEVINELSSKDGITKNMQSHFKELVSKGIENTYDNFVSDVMKDYDDEKAKKKEDYNSNENNFDFGRVSGYESIDDQEIWRIATDEDKKISRLVGRSR